MCGIAGFNWRDEATAAKMARALRHRGPDQSGTFADESVSLGHSRLSIIDLSDKGRQPIANEDRSLWLVCNGEIYNFGDIRKELEGRHVFSSATDTEVILHAYEEWGTDAFRRLNGMWAFCLYDQKAGTLVLSRDRVGKKPLYYACDGTRFIFASELKAIVEPHAWERTISKEALDFYFSLGYIPSPWSVYEGIFKVEPRQFLVYDLRSHALKKDAYFEIPTYAPVTDRARLVREGRTILRDAVRLRLLADVPVGAFLSGGLDSSAVVAAMTGFVAPSGLHTFSIGFEGAYDESSYMTIVKDAFKTRHHFQNFTEEDFERTWDLFPRFFDEPFDNTASFPTMDLSRMARRFVTVCLSGDGGDEIFGGYKMHRRAVRQAALRKIPALVRVGLFKALKKGRPGRAAGKLKEMLRLSVLPAEDFYLEAGGNPAFKPETFRHWSRQKMREALARTGGNLVQAVIDYDLYVHTLPDFFLCKVDRASMAHALEVRCPFLDLRFLEFAARIPVRWKASRKQSKILLRRIIRDMVPPAIAGRAKKGFTPPILDWMDKDKYKRIVREAVEMMRREGILDRAWLEFFATDVLDKNDGPGRSMRMRILVFLQWWKTWMAG